MAKEQEG